jgi:hypothetical protein
VIFWSDIPKWILGLGIAAGAAVLAVIVWIVIQNTVPAAGAVENLRDEKPNGREVRRTAPDGGFSAAPGTVVDTRRKDVKPKEENKPFIPSAAPATGTNTPGTDRGRAGGRN